MIAEHERRNVLDNVFSQEQQSALTDNRGMLST